MRRAQIALLVSLAMLSAATAWAEPPRDPDIQVKDKSDEHRYSLGLQGGLAAGGLVVALTGVGLFAHSLDIYNSAVAGTTDGGTSCRPCASSDLTELRAYNYAGYALMAAGGIILIADVALIAVDAQHRKDRRERRERSVAKLGRPLSFGVRF